MLPNKKPLKYGINLNSSAKSKIKTKPSIDNLFGNEEANPENDREEIEKVNNDIRLSASRSYNSKKVLEQLQDTLEEDSTAFDYDEIYDQMKQRQREVTDSLKGTDTKQPRYIQGLLKTAELRKRDRLRAEEKMLEKEREREGEEFADKESFVTSAYKEQQAELKRLEGQDNKKEIKNELGSLTGMYSAMLESRSKIHEAGIIKETKSVVIETNEREVSDQDVIFETLSSGKKVELNDDNEIIDRRQLLSAGLNVSKKIKLDEASVPALSAYDEFVQRRNKELEAQKELRAEAQRKRLTQQLHKQLVEKEVESTQKEEEKLKELSKQMARKTDAEGLLSARERYLARKKATG